MLMKICYVCVYLFQTNVEKQSEKKRKSDIGSCESLTYRILELKEQKSKVKNLSYSI